MIFKFSGIDLKTINGDPIPSEEVRKLAANIIYLRAKDLDLVQVALDLNSKDELELNKKQLRGVKETLISDQSSLSAFVKKAVRDYIDELFAVED